MTDGTEHDRAEARLRYRLELESAVAEISHRFVHADAASLDAVIELALARMSALAGADRGYLFQLSEDGASFRTTHECYAEGAPRQPGGSPEHRTADFARLLEALQRTEVMHVPNVAELPDDEQPLKSVLIANRVRSFVIVPVAWEGRLRGFLGFDAMRELRSFPEEDIRLLRTVAEIMSRAMAGREAARRIADDAWFLENLDRVARVLARSQDVPDLLHALSALLLEIFAVDRAWLSGPCDPEAPAMRMSAEVTRPEYPGALAAGIEIPVDDDLRALIRATLADDAPVEVHAAFQPEVATLYGVRSMMATAVRPRGESAWLMGLHQCSHHRQWKPRERRLFRAIAERASEVMALHVVNQKLRESEGRLAFVLESNPAIVYAAHLVQPVRCTYMSPNIEKILGYAPEQVMSTPDWLRTVVHPDDEPALLRMIAEIRGTGRAIATYRVRKRDGTYVWLQDEKVAVPGQGEHPHAIGCFIDVSQRIEAEQALERARAQAEQALATAEGRLRLLEMAEEVAHFGHWRVDLATGALTWSKELFRIHGMVPQGDAGPPDFAASVERFYPRDKDLIQATLAMAMAEKRVVVSEAELVLPDGTRRWLQTHAAPELDAHDDITAMFGVTHDITQHKRDQEALVRAREEALAASRVKSQFLANMSHEIRTPLNGVLGLTALLLDSPLSAEQRELLEMVRTSGRTLHELIEGVLDISKIEAGKLELEAVPFPLCNVVQDAARTVAVRAHEKGLELVVDLAPDLPTRVIGDPVRFRQVLTNLLANAVKFTPAGEIELGVRRDAGDDIVVSVRDTGIGVPPERHEAIFEAFTQADGSTTREYGGTGLGLAICRELVERMGGRIWVESAPGGGSVFRFRAALPPAGDQGGTCIPALAPTPLRGARALVVDDNQATRRVLAGLLRSWHMEPVVCASAREALAAADRAAQSDQPFDFALIDAALGDAALGDAALGDAALGDAALGEAGPGEAAPGGIALAEALARDPRCRATTRLLLVNASFRPEPALLDDGIVARCLIKPVSPSTLLDALLLGSAPAATPAKLPAPAPAGLHVLLAEDNPMNALLIKRILARSDCHVVHVTTGTAALAAWDGQRFDVILMDMQMPEIDGLEATRRIRARERRQGTRTPIIALTANALKEDEQRCRDAGMDEYLPKPIDIARFLRVLSRIRPARAQQPAFDAGAMAEQLGGDREIVAAVVATFLDSERSLLSDIESAFAAGDLGALQRAAHHARGSLLVLHAHATAEAALAVELAARAGERERTGAAMPALRQAWSALVRELGASGLAAAAPDA